MRNSWYASHRTTLNHTESNLFLCLFCVMLWLISTIIIGQAASMGDTAPTGWWSFDEGSGTSLADSSGGGNNALIANELRGVKWVDGRKGKALAFTGNQATRNANGCVVVPGIGKHDFSKGITVEAWIKPASTMKREGTYEIVSNTVADRGPGLRLILSWESLCFRSGEGGDGKTWGAASNTAETQIKPDRWYHVAGTYDGSVFRVYLDGVEVGHSEANLALTQGHADVYVGAYCNGYAYGFEGSIDEVRLYPAALTPLQILRHARLAW